MAAYLDAFLSRIGLRGPEESKVLFIGQDAAGKTALLYRLKFPEQDMLTTIPTIGFNVESVRVRSPAGARGLQIWDVGGCDRIRPLWRHYFAGTDLVVIFMTGEDCCAGRAEEAGLILSELAEDETVRRPFLILVTKQDLPGAAGPDEFRRVHAKELRKFAVMSPVLGISVTTRKGFDELASFMVEACSSKQSGVPSILPPKGSEENEKPKLLEWLERQDEPNDEFLAKLADCTLDSWDHRTHLRIAWLHLTRFGRREGLERTFNSIRNFIANSERARKTTFHFTMTYFFIHLVHYAIVSTLNPTGDFPGFLAANPQLSDGGIYLRYYSKQLMLHTPESRERMVLPDLKPLPSIITGAVNLKGTLLPDSLPPVADDDGPSLATLALNDGELTDEEFLARFKQRQLSSWGHRTMLRLIWIVITAASAKGRRRTEAADQIFELLRGQMGGAFNLRLAYFWMHMVYLAAASAPRGCSFNHTVGSLRKEYDLEDAGLWKKFYSDAVMFAEPTDSMAFPDKRPLPSTVAIKR